MTNIKTRGIVIKRMNYGEADRILTILTVDCGKIKAMAKGVRKIKSRMAGSLEPYMLVNLQLHEGKTFYIVTGAEILEEYKNIHSEIKKTAQAYFVGELVDRFLEEHQRAEVIFEISVEIFRIIDCADDVVGTAAGAVSTNENSSRIGTSKNNNFIISAYQLKIVEVAGFKPELFDCLHCKEKLSAGQNFWDHIEGGVICNSCQQKFNHGDEISDEAIKALRFIEQNSFKNIAKLKLEQKTEAELDKILLEYIKNILERDIKSRKFLRQVG